MRSSASAWGVTSKHRLGKLAAARIVGQCAAAIRGLRANELAAPAHALRKGTYAHAHRDPFDRILAAQAAVENLRIVSRDAALQFTATVAKATGVIDGVACIVSAKFSLL